MIKVETLDEARNHLQTLYAEDQKLRENNLITWQKGDERGKSMIKLAEDIKEIIATNMPLWQKFDHSYDFIMDNNDFKSYYARWAALSIQIQKILYEAPYATIS